jgi:hypothetical protein
MSDKEQRLGAMLEYWQRGWISAFLYKEGR